MSIRVCMCLNENCVCNIKPKFRCVHGLTANCNACSTEHMQKTSESAINFNWFREKIERLEEKIYNIEKNISIKKPHKCPVCYGHGHDKALHSSDINFLCHGSPCKACEGKGILWS